MFTVANGVYFAKVTGATLTIKKSKAALFGLVHERAITWNDYRDFARYKYSITVQLRPIRQRLSSSHVLPQAPPQAAAQLRIQSLAQLKSVFSVVW